jgi:hypothetical protein
MDYHRKILFPVFIAESASTSVFDLLPVTLHLSFNHGLPVNHTISGKAKGAQAIEAWNFFASKGENSHQWVDTPFFHR